MACTLDRRVAYHAADNSKGSQLVADEDLQRLVIAVDGTAGSGKSTTSRAVALRLGRPDAQAGLAEASPGSGNQRMASNDGGRTASSIVSPTDRSSRLAMRLLACSS